MILPGVCGVPTAQARLFHELPVVEVQETFSRPVTLKRAEGWRRRAPPNFVFTVKASQFITHDISSESYRGSELDLENAPEDRYGSFRDTSEVSGGWSATEAVAAALRAKAIVFETPSSFGPRPENLRNLYGFFENIRPAAWSLVWEPRGTWPSYVIEKVCADLGIVHCVDPFGAESVTIGLAYFRLHGSPPGSRTYDYAYTEQDLARLRDIALEYDDAYVLFDNVTRFDDAVRLQSLVNVGK